MKEFGELGVCDPRDLEGVGKRLQRWNMGACRPAPAGLRVNDTNSKSLIWHNSWGVTRRRQGREV
ncbi:hypothetical protein [Rhizobium leguminosarum]|uniref:hypothetical protein n=1 Tax=Rhizobium leguminosarum TaxID=384 RepID=UPI0024A8FF39|nr:hypothetical protein [Rhizobium leguminosarum]MDI5930119.1 hypothetical protein [Rhizobium leguminosarum]